MLRKKVSFVPSFEGRIEGCVINFLKKNYWRVAGYYEFEDCIQEAYLKFMVVKDGYPEVIDPPHFMALFKTAWKNRFTDMSNQRTADEAMREADLSGEDKTGNPITLTSLMDRNASTHHAGRLAVLKTSAPIEVKALLRAFDEPDKIELLREKCRKIRKGNRKARRETTNEKLCRIVGLDGEFVSIQRMFVNHFA